MKYNIYGVSADQPEVTLRLLKVGSHTFVSAVNAKGATVSGGNLVCFNADGTVTMMQGVSRMLGFKLDDVGSIKIKD